MVAGAGALVLGGVLTAGQGTAAAATRFADRTQEVDFGGGVKCVLQLSSYFDPASGDGRVTTLLIGGGDSRCFDWFHRMIAVAVYTDRVGIERRVRAEAASGQEATVVVDDVGESFQGEHRADFELCRCAVGPYTTTPK